jgi:arylsulfatase A-like enzyme
MLKSHLAAALFAVLFAPVYLIAAHGAALAAPAQPPNIVVFLVDDMGWQDTSVPFHTAATPFNRRYHTPNMERLAAGGMKFTQAYACTVCSPTRVSLMTGLNAARHRVTNWILRVDPATDKEHPTLRFPDWNSGGMSATSGVARTVHATPLAEVLRQAGYRTIHVGKAHFGALDTPGADPRNLGFDLNIAGHAAGAPASYLGTKNFSGPRPNGNRDWDVPGLEKYHGQDIFLTEALTLEANAAMDAAVADHKPFYLYMAHYAVHTPYSADARFYQKYRDAGLDDKEAMYAALVEGMDKSLGDILDNVQRHGLSEQTIVLFMSDNGGLSAHARGGPPHTHNRPLASGKGSAYEGGIRVPMIVRSPGITAPGSSCSQPVIIEDFFPTILELAGVENFRQLGGVIDGRSFVGLLHGRHDPARDDRPLFWHYPNNWGGTGPGIAPSSTIRHGDWKLIYYYADGRYELFNLANDLGEDHDLADAKPEIRDRLARELGDYLAGVSAQVPIDKNSGNPLPLPGAAP